MQLTSATMKHSIRGFSLIEMLVALLVISIGLLGIAKMQALALSNTSGGRIRALAAIEAGGLASAIASDRNYWGNVTSLTVTVAPGTTSASPVITSTDTTLAGTASCNASDSPTSAPCTSSQMAAYDLNSWAKEFQSIMGVSGASNYFAQIGCSTYASANNQVTCQITVNWAESNISANTSQTVAMATPSYTLYVSP